MNTVTLSAFKTNVESTIQGVVSTHQPVISGIGRPEPLRFQWSGYWSRRINKEHRLVYKVHADCVYIVQCRYHY
jgi:Txe/YoeB family toxin of toxin-antitoxin system